MISRLYLLREIADERYMKVFFEDRRWPCAPFCDKPLLGGDTNVDFLVPLQLKSFGEAAIIETQSVYYSQNTDLQTSV